MSVVVIENEAVRVGVTPAYGARVVSLVDRHSGREWMTQGAESANTGENADYRGPEAVGWDECFPTVSPWDAGATAWGRRLRDHGDLWGRPWHVELTGPEDIKLSYTSPQFRFSRELRLDGAALIAHYSVENRSSAELPYLWALHALLAVKPNDRMKLHGVDKVRASYLSLGGQTLPVSELSWSGPNGALPFALDEVQPASSAFAGKFLVGGLAGGRARIGQPGQWLELGWDSSIENLGIWLTYGGWPGPGGHYEAALEPTSALADHLGQAIEGGFLPLAPGERRDWRVTLTVMA